MTFDDAWATPAWPVDDEVSAQELARRQGVGPVCSFDEMIRPELFESDAELNAFVFDLYASRRAAAPAGDFERQGLHRFRRV